MPALRTSPRETAPVGSGKASPTTGSAESSEKAIESLSQFIARVLNQLSLSAWLPAAALVLGVALAVSVGNELDRDQALARGAGPLVLFGRALAALTNIGVGGGLLLLASIVVLTMVTQAFAFEAIRILEGYWGTHPLVESVAGLRCQRHRHVQAELATRSRRLLESAWTIAQAEIQRIQDDLALRGGDVEVTPDMLAALRAEVLGTGRSPDLTEDERRFIGDLDWEQFAPSEQLRRRVNVEKRLQDYPDAHRILPTWMGNILRHHEDETQSGRVETFIQENFEFLPSSLKIEHDEQRTRLDLYCSMVFVVGVIAGFAAFRFLPHHLAYAAAAGLLGILGMVVMYRAAVASARAYGGLLVVIAGRLEGREEAEADPAP